MPSTAPVLRENALFSTSVGGLERTGSKTETVAVSNQPFSSSLKVSIGTDSPESNATQLTIPNLALVQKGDAMVATLWARGETAKKAPAHIEFLFEKATDPWTKSVVLDIFPTDKWKRFVIPFASASDFAPAEAMASIRFAFGPQTVEVADLHIVSYGKTKTADELGEIVAAQNPLGKVEVSVDLKRGAQLLGGLGGNFAQPRYGKTEPMDAIGQYNLDHLQVAQARIGIPLNNWAPEPGVFKDEGPAHAALLQMQIMAARKIPIIGSVWEGPSWLVGGEPEQSGKVLPRERYDDCIETIAQFLVTARDKYHAPVAYFSFNEADYGVNFKFSPTQIADFIALAGPRFRALKIETKFLVGDTANGTNLPDYARPLLENRAIAPFLGPIAFHCWDVLGADEDKYRQIKALGVQYNKEIFCTEAGHDSALWQQPNPWQGWNNALRTALAYERTLRLSGASVLDYWTYQDNYPLVSADGKTPYPVWNVVQTLGRVLSKGNRIVEAVSGNDDLKVLATRGPKVGQFAVVLINPQGEGEITLRGLPQNAVYSTVSNSATSPQSGVWKPRYTDSQGTLKFSLPARSMLSIFSGSRQGR